MPIEFIIGNGDRETLAAKRGGVSAAVPEYFHEAMAWNAAQLSETNAKAIDKWPLTRRLHVGGIGDVLFCHATPRNDTEIFMRTTSDATLLPIFDPLHVHAVVCGHTHMQHDRTVGTTRIINAGSIGASFQGPGAYWALLGPTVQLRRTYYDVEQAAARVRATSVSAGRAVCRHQRARAADGRGHAQAVRERGDEVGAAESTRLRTRSGNRTVLLVPAALASAGQTARAPHPAGGPPPRDSGG